MTNNNWNDTKIEKLLGDLPEITDNRSKSEIFERLKQDERLSVHRRKRLTRWMPALVAIAALLVVGLLIPSMLRSDDSAMKSDSSDSTMMRSNDFDTSATEDESAKMATAEEQMENSSTMKAENGVHHFAVYPENISDATLFHLGLAGDQASSIPVSFVIPNDQIEKDFGTINPTSYDLYTEYAVRIDEEALGFNAYHPYKGVIVLDGNVLIHQLPKGHGYDLSSATMEVYFNTLQDTFYGFKEIQFQNEDQSAVVFSEAGQPSTPLVLKSGTNHFSYYLFEQEDGQRFLSSNFSQPQQSVVEALQQMRIKPNDVFKPVIPAAIEFEVNADTEVTYVKFTKPLDLETLEPEKGMLMIEGMLLTAASFGEQLQFENVVQEEWNGFSFSQPLPVPIGSNPLPLILK